MKAGEKIELVAIRPGKKTEVYLNRKLYADDTIIVSLFDFSNLKKEFAVEGEIVIDRQSTAICADFPGKPYEILIVYDASGNLKGYYVNINRNIVVEGDRVMVHDLFLDIWVFPDMRWKILDEEEFRDAVEKRLVADEDVALANSTLEMFLREFESRQFEQRIRAILGHIR